jgi:hypothetical protein
MFQDRLMATQTANLMNIQGRAVEKTIQPEQCMTFVWEPKKPVTEMTEEDMERFDQNMDTHAHGRLNG